MDLQYGSYKPTPSLLEPCSDRSPAQWIRLFIQVTMLFLIVTGNSIVILSVLAVKVLRNPQNFMVMSLAVADLLVGLVVMPLKITLTENCEVWKAGPVCCYVFVSCDVMLCTSSILSLTAIAIDRYFAVEKPLFHRIHFTRTKVYGSIAFSWIFSLVLIIPFWASTTFHHQVIIGNITLPVCSEEVHVWHKLGGAVVFFLLPVCILIGVYRSIARVLKNQHSKLKIKASAEVLAHTATADGPTIPTCPVCQFFHEKKGCFMTGIVVVSFIVCLFPLFSVMFLDAVYTILGKNFSVPSWIFDTFVWLVYFHSCVNPFIYTMFNKDFRFAFKELICCRCLTLNSRIRSDLYSKQTAASTTSSSTASVNSGRKFKPFDFTENLS